MRRFSLLMLLALLTIGCNNGVLSGEDDTIIEPPKQESPVIEFTGSTSYGNIHEVEPNTETTTIEFEVDTPWVLTFASYNNESTEWISADKTSGQAGKHSVTLRMEPNNTPDNRLVRVEIRNKSVDTFTRVTDIDVDDMINSIQGVCYMVSILQNRYYADKYPVGVRVNLNAGYMLKDLIDEYVAEKNITYDDIEYLDVRGNLGNSTHIDSNYDFINNSLTNLKELDLYHADMIEIPVGAFMGNRSIHYITLPHYLQSIGDNAFMNSELRNVNLRIPPHVEYVGMNAFAGTQIGGSIIIGTNTGFISIMDDAFNTPYIFTVVFKEGMSIIEGGKNTFNPALSFMILPETLMEIRHWYLNNVGIICCYAIDPPHIIDSILMQPDRVGGVLVPVGSYLFYTDPYDPWSNLPIYPAL